MAKTKTRRWDVVKHLKTDADLAAYLEAALEDGDPALIIAVLSDIVPRSRTPQSLWTGDGSIVASPGLGAHGQIWSLRPIILFTDARWTPAGYVCKNRMTSALKSAVFSICVQWPHSPKMCMSACGNNR